MNNISYCKSDKRYHITGWIVWNKDCPVVNPLPVSDELIEFEFSRMDYGNWKYIESNILDVYIDPVTRLSMVSYNFVLLRSFIVKFLLKAWNLPIELNFDNHGVLTDECFARVMKIYPSIMRYFVEKIENTFFMDDEARARIAKQSLMLFGKSGVGVKEPHEAISLYCDLTSFWEKFGLNYFDMQRIPQDTYVKLRTVLMHEVDVKNQQMKEVKNKPSHSGGRKMIDYKRF